MDGPKPEIKIGFAETQGPNPETEQRIETVWGNIRVVSAVPDWTPRGRQEDSMAMYVSGSTTRLYFYDFTNQQWRFFTNTRVASDGGAMLEGDVEIAGDGIEVTQSGQTITIGSGVPFVGTANSSTATTGGDPHVDITFSPGFDPSMIWFYGRIDDASLSSTLLFNAELATNIVQAPMIWIDGTYKVGRRQQSANPTVWSDYTDAFLKTDFDASLFEYEVLVQSHDDTNTVIRLCRVSGSGNLTVHYKFFIICFP